MDEFKLFRTFLIPNFPFNPKRNFPTSLLIACNFSKAYLLRHSKVPAHALSITFTPEEIIAHFMKHATRVIPDPSQG